ncbi:MAG: rod-binding protein, partial [Bdellovibrionales bacterium]|nr:rod-binding protein [Bdellovibrionales bacterium]
LFGSREEEMYRDMLNEALAKSVTEGKGIGIKEVIVNDMKKVQGIE